MYILIYSGYALIQLPETLIYMHNRIKVFFGKIAPSDRSIHTEVPKAVYQKPHSKAEVESSPTMKMILQKFPMHGNNQQNNQNICQLVECLINEQDVLTRRMDKIEQKKSSTL